MTKLLILGAGGMLGDAVTRYFSQTPDYIVTTINDRWPSNGFEEAIRSAGPEVIINCIGKIPQKSGENDSYQEINVELPAFLDTLGIPIVHPSTDCEFSGDLTVGNYYTKTSLRDAHDAYGKSKAEISEQIQQSFKNTKIIRTSIIGHERMAKVALLDWFLSSSGTVKGFTNHYWNGVTTLQWAELCANLIKQWESFPVLNQYGTHSCQSKYQVLETIRNVYKKDIEIVPFKTDETVNKCLESDVEIPSLDQQLERLRIFYNR
ncbi:MAG TPA: sugar nucleotide-binding protein [Candidatus Paceibacterota bacterium]|nr:sugar nucleotide-binding protein [Candidatus Paceibacterota bacterium]